MTRSFFIRGLMFVLLAATPAAAEAPLHVSPARAFGVLGSLEKVSGRKVVPAAAEVELFADAADGELDKFSFAEACLIASGVTDAADRQRLLARLDKLTEAARKATASTPSPTEKARKLLTFLHTSAMAKGYQTKQSSVAEVLERGRYNCVSSAALYNVVGRRLDLDVRAIEVPHHVFSVLVVKDRYVDVETTNAQGFDPHGDRKRPDGLGYDPTTQEKDRREVGELGLAAVLYYNRGVDLASARKWPEAVAANCAALCLDPSNPAAVQNLQAGFDHWTRELSKAGKHDDALRVLKIGVGLIRKADTLRHNAQVVAQEWIQHADARGGPTAAAQVVARLKERFPEYSKEIAELAVNHAGRAVQALLKRQRFADAVAAVARYAVLVEDEKELRELGVAAHDGWARHLAGKKDFPAAVTKYAEGLKAYPGDSHLGNNLEATCDEWAGPLKKRGEWAEAIKVYEAGLKVLPDSGHLQYQKEYCEKKRSK